MFEIEFLNGARTGVVIVISKSLRAGRLPDCDIEVPDAMVGRHHMDIHNRGSHCEIVDNKSGNGVYVNEERIQQHHLEPGDIIRVGDTRFRFQLKVETGQSGMHSGVKSAHLDMREDFQVNLKMSLSVADVHARSEAVDDAATLKVKLKAIVDITEQLGSIEDVKELYASIINSIFNLFPQSDRGFILLGDNVAQLQMAGARQRGRDRVSELRVSRSLCQAALEKKAIVLYQDGGDVDFKQGLSLANLHIRSAMVAPLMSKGDILGLILIDTAGMKQEFDQDDMELLATVSSHLAFSIKNALLFEQQESDANMRRNFMRFLPKPVVEQMLDGEIDIELGGNKYEGTIFFSDIVGFTTMSENMKPEQVIQTMNDYFADMVPCIDRTGGAIDKFVGDAIMAFWGIPFNDGTSAYKAVSAALTMHTRMAAFNCKQEKLARPTIYTAIGLSTGPVVAGNVGTAERVEYTVLGDTVNAASRIEEIASADQVLVNMGTWNALAGKAIGIAMPPLLVKNKKNPLDTFSVRGLLLKDNEIILHVPVRIDGVRMYIVQALKSKQFTLLHPKGARVHEAEVFTDMIEMTRHSLGHCCVQVELPAVATDNGLCRSLVLLEDQTLGGLLYASSTPNCGMSWDHMSRANSLPK